MIFHTARMVAFRLVLASPAENPNLTLLLGVEEVYFAELVEQAERYDEMETHMEMVR